MIVLHFILIACFIVLRDIGDDDFGASSSVLFKGGSFVSLATIQKSENLM